MTVLEIKLEQPATASNVQQIICEQVEQHGLLLYIKGTPWFPQCGFSAQIIEIFNRLEADYASFNVLEDTLVREGIKQYSNWPTIPQVYNAKKFLGGCDIVTEMYQTRALQKLLGIQEKA